MCPGSIGSLSSTSPTGSAVSSWSSCASRFSESLLRCCTITTGMSKPAGSPPTIVLSAVSPPQDAPITTTSYEGLPFGCCPPRSTRVSSLHLAVDLVALADLVVARLEGREAQRLLAAQSENAEHDQALIKQAMDP